MPDLISVELTVDCVRCAWRMSSTNVLDPLGEFSDHLKSQHPLFADIGAWAIVAKITARRTRTPILTPRRSGDNYVTPLEEIPHV